MNRARPSFDRGFWATALGLGLTILVTHVGGLRYEVPNPDEATFMLLASDLLDGALPYVERFDNKPPGIFFVLALVMGVFGESLVVVRLFGDACLLWSALMVYAIARPDCRPAAAAAGGLAVVAMHAVYPGMHTSVGIVAMAALMTALFLLMRRVPTLWSLTAIGLLVSVATLLRTNLAYVAIGLGAWLTLGGLFWRAGGLPRWALLPYGIAGLVPPGLFALLYAAAGAFRELRLASVDVALNYTSTYSSTLGQMKLHLFRWLSFVADHPLIYGGFTALGLLALGWLGVRSVGTRPHDPGRVAAWVGFWVILGTTVLSIGRSGAIYATYWQQVFPLAGVLIAYLFERLRSHPPVLVGAAAVLALMVGAGVWRGLPDTWRVLTAWDRVRAEDHWVRRAAEAIDAVRRPKDRIWALDRHLVMWILDAPTVSRVVGHPSNIKREVILAPLIAAGYVPADELDRVYASEPEFLVTNGDAYLYYFDDSSRFDAFVAANYHRFFAQGDILVFRHNGHPSR